MPAIGNDIVNLTDPDNRRRSADVRFLNRVFTAHEQELIARCRFPDLAVWSMWAAKEAAYKVASKTHGEISSSPRRYEIFPTFNDPAAPAFFRSGQVSTPSAPVFFQVVSGYDFVHCLCAASLADFSVIRSGIARLEDQGSRKDNQALESQSARRIATEAMASVLQLPLEGVEIRRPGGLTAAHPPLVFYEGRQLPVDLSLSHDWPWVAYAFAII